MSDIRECDTCGRQTDAGEWPDWVNGSCEFCDPWILDDISNCNTCGGTGRWESTFEEAPTVLVDLGPCPDCLEVSA